MEDLEFLQDDTLQHTILVETFGVLSDSISICCLFFCKESIHIFLVTVWRRSMETYLDTDFTCTVSNNYTGAIISLGIYHT